jgi:hypothetical protein
MEHQQQQQESQQLQAAKAHENPTGNCKPVHISNSSNQAAASTSTCNMPGMNPPAYHPPQRKEHYISSALYVHVCYANLTTVKHHTAANV